MGHDAKVSLKHYAQTTDDHFNRAASGAECGAPEAQNAAQQTTAGNRRERNESPEDEARQVVIAFPCGSLRYIAEAFNGEGGIRTPETGFPV
jgi:hypothetical protein